MQSQWIPLKFLDNAIIGMSSVEASLFKHDGFIKSPEAALSIHVNERGFFLLDGVVKLQHFGRVKIINIY